MTPKSQRLIYWDACVFLSYVNNIPDRAPIIEQLLDDISEKKDRKIVTATLSIVEVACRDTEKLNHLLDPELEETLNGFWQNPNIELIEFHPDIAYLGRSLLRDSAAHGRGLKPMDAVHLASAQWVDNLTGCVEEFHTFDKQLLSWGPSLGIHTIQPYNRQPKLPRML